MSSKTQYTAAPTEDSFPGVASTPAAQGVDINGMIVGRWKSSFFGCTDTLVPNACMSLICPAISIAQICARLGLCKYWHVLSGFFFLYLFALIAACSKSPYMQAITVICSFIAAILVARLRWRIRFLFSLPGSVFEDIWTSFLCGCCAISQMATQVESYTPGSCAFGPRNTLEGYTFA